MKRSTAVSLVLMGSAAFALSGCKPKAETYPSAEACIEARDHTESECNEAFAAARHEHETAAPHFASRDECTASYGPNGCEERRVEGGGGFFMPMMLGYMLGRGMGFHPLYQNRYSANGFVAPGGASFGGYTYGQRGAATGETGATMRGGFGETGRSLSAGG
jgi:uncharacterized protein YgiB involved in biofilm formation